MKLLKLQQVMEKTSLCSSSIYNLMKEGDFPKNISVMGKRKAWLESDVEEWMLKKLQATESTS